MLSQNLPVPPIELFTSVVAKFTYVEFGSFALVWTNFTCTEGITCHGSDKRTCIRVIICYSSSKLTCMKKRFTCLETHDSRVGENTPFTTRGLETHDTWVGQYTYHNTRVGDYAFVV